jgi:hypothetical protein
MRGLTLTQPWATLVAIGEKRVETRAWNTGYRGPIAIHAALKMPRAVAEMATTDPVFSQVLRQHGRMRGWRTWDDGLPRGVIVATAELVDCLPTLEALMFIRDQPARVGLHEESFGDYSSGRYGFVLDRVRMLRTPVRCRGALSLWAVPDDVRQVVLENER